MVLERKRVTIEEFDHFVMLPQNADLLFEFIGGEIIEVPSNPYSSKIALLIAFHIQLYLREKGMQGHVTGEQGGYMVSGERYAPDVAFLSKDRILAREGYNPDPPNLAVEVISPTATDKQLMIKVGNYLAAETLVWIVYPGEKEVVIYEQGKPVRTLYEDGTLDGGDVLPGFTLEIKNIFPEE